MKYFLIAGEASGDLHGSNLIKAIKLKDPTAEFKFWGGDLMMEQAGNVGLLMHYKQVTIMGFVEVVLNLKSIFNNIKRCKDDIIAYQPDVVILIDYPGFNLRIAEFCKQKGIKTAYYIAPKIWAWKESRGKKLEKFVDELLLIFPFEVDYFKKWKVNATYVGNPLLDAISNHQPKTLTATKTDTRPIIALLPGSRKQEINKILPLMLKVVEHYPTYQFVIAGAPGLEEQHYAPFLNNNVKLVFGQTYDLLKNSTAAIVCSGTATLETALFGVPQVCGYVANPISVAIARMLVKINYISLVNLCLNRTSITELIQQDFNLERTKQELDAVLPNGSSHKRLMDDYEELQELLGGVGASNRAADVVIKLADRK